MTESGAAASSRPGTAATLEAAWAAAVRANRDQAERVREEFEADFYGTTSRRFVVDPLRTDDPTLDALLALAQSGESWIDIGAGAGRFALPLALRVREVIALDPSPSMLASLRAGMAEHGIANVRVIDGRWPIAPEVGTPPVADVALMAHVGYDIEEIGPFLDAAESASRRLCVAVLADRAPSMPAAVVWPAVHGEDRAPLPALPEFVALLVARGATPRVEVTERAARTHADVAEAHGWLRHQCFIAPGGAADQRLAAAVAAFPRTPAGEVLIPVEPLTTAVISWEPRRP